MVILDKPDDDDASITDKKSLIASKTDVLPTPTSANGSGTVASTNTGTAPATAPATATTANTATTTTTTTTSTSFIHKLYSMLEDESLNHLIYWHSNKSSFYVSPTEEFSKVLSTYFKHANTASFIRQLNMYGFHKINDSYNTEKDETPSTPNNSEEKDSSRKNSVGSSTTAPQIWEFKHSSGAFKQGNLESLNQIKRRSFKNVASQKEVHNLKTSLTQSYTLEESPSETQQAPPQPISAPPTSVLPSAPAPPPPPAAAQQQQQQMDLEPEVQSYTPYRYQNNEFEHQDELEMKSKLTNKYLHQQMISTIQQQQQKDSKLIDLTNKYEQLNHKYEILKEDLTKTNYDCVSVLDLLRDLVHSFGHTAQDDSRRLFQELDKFKSNILQRSATRDMSLKQLTPGYYPDTRTSLALQPQFFAHQQQQLQQQQQHQLQHQHPHLHPQQQQQQQQQPPPPPSSLSAQSQFQQHDQQPFLHKDIRYSVTSNRSRNLSVFDPLQPISPQFHEDPQPHNSNNIRFNNSINNKLNKLNKLNNHNNHNNSVHKLSNVVV
ncbi:hypothetical protein CANARDRAFT_167607 [[Candida] arabinofermentans NRRL YB-2248]|uniref:HSF-type DNA-binding domain-containing protein n=1 Tax=[Candida] arabinofermentans NRRL YB-2248 TaxID=983967 RepID=A0A1E4SZQ0_9ASCO|nr:hypothetical protein CANARDRAFT_167607 [[Candida] arabinofermentans NRRL YB-2248]